MIDLETLFNDAKLCGITKRQIGIVLYGKNWRNIYKLKSEYDKMLKRNQKISNAIEKLIDAQNL